jgi:hypothetical protein
MIKLPGKRLEIDVRRVHMRVKIRARLGVDISCRDRHRLDSAFVGCLRAVNRILGENHRIVVSERDAVAADPCRRFRHLFGRCPITYPVNRARF